ncbi:MAG TPA: tannase/feruloyl esterase family alpha/beta hydrolase, partial [Edaphobacter sp.]
MPARSLLFAALFLFAAPVLRAESCDSLKKLASAQVVVDATTSVPEGGFGSQDSRTRLKALPAFCRVALTLKPTSDSEIHAEVWLPMEEWNGKFMAVGSGGWGGSINHGSMAEALRRGYATAATDDGHKGESASFVVGHPEKFVDFAYRAEREMT